MKKFIAKILYSFKKVFYLKEYLEAENKFKELAEEYSKISKKDLDSKVSSMREKRKKLGIYVPADMKFSIPISLEHNVYITNGYEEKEDWHKTCYRVTVSAYPDSKVVVSLKRNNKIIKEEEYKKK